MYINSRIVFSRFNFLRFTCCCCCYMCVVLSSAVSSTTAFVQLEIESDFWFSTNVSNFRVASFFFLSFFLNFFFCVSCPLLRCYVIDNLVYGTRYRVTLIHCSFSSSLLRISHTNLMVFDFNSIVASQLKLR